MNCSRRSSRWVHEDHRRHVAMWWGEVFGGPSQYTDDLGGYERMLRKHLDPGIAEDQKFRNWRTLGDSCHPRILDRVTRSECGRSTPPRLPPDLSPEPHLRLTTGARSLTRPSRGTSEMVT
jgi:hypothetical protein